MCVRERESMRERAYVCVRERKREVCVWGRERVYVCVHCVRVYVCAVWEGERERECVCVCACEREYMCVCACTHTWEKERERECVYSVICIVYVKVCVYSKCSSTVIPTILEPQLGKVNAQHKYIYMNTTTGSYRPAWSEGGSRKTLSLKTVLPAWTVTHSRQTLVCYAVHPPTHPFF